MTGFGDVETDTCLVCVGRGRMKCDFCGGTGTVGGPAMPAGGRRRRGGDRLEGRWDTQTGTSYEFTRDGDSYSVTEISPMGPSGNGTATLDGNTVHMNVTNVLIGNYSVSFSFNGQTLQGRMTILGMPMNVVMRRV